MEQALIDYYLIYQKNVLNL